MKASSVVRQLTDAMDGVPIHVRQLSEMFRKHGQKQSRNNSDIVDLDNTDIPQPLRDGWKADSDWTPDSIVSWKGDAPDPSEYLDGDYVKQHLARFENGASRIYFSDSLDVYGPGQRDHSTFVFPVDELDRVINETGGNAHEIAKRLGIDAKYFHVDEDIDKPLLDVEIRYFSPDELDNLRIPSGNEAGANKNWIPGGYLPTGIPEAVIDVPGSATGSKGDNNIELWPGVRNSLDVHL